MTVRIQRVGNPGPLVHTVHAFFITLGVIIGSSVGGLAVDRFGLRATLCLGAGLAALGVLSLLPELGSGKAQLSKESPVRECVEAAPDAAPSSRFVRAGVHRVGVKARSSRAGSGEGG
ncbi:hypothetical protein [Kitasatospora sp. CB01950]|uniref:hypothetical protein n=1 Tax=Kitasatospora sp. CB01950 TaxID=1703930 RepID=UPI00093AD145|nr:hypothetical protein [Kitasatospora sp. CB01950]OKJ13790.1 hypothetical protein AMK19_10285 [Kitasatospora sp. CB01950]